jgi:transcriptional regulator with XRE-family HTH domain
MPTQMQTVSAGLRFGMTVRKQRKILNLSQEELAGRAGLHRTYISDIERGGRNLSLGSMERIAAGLGVSIRTLFDDFPDNRPPEPVTEMRMLSALSHIRSSCL